ncbi:hypothetical protein [Paratractidigestivibacter sp.]|uniref:hypothetical protein n=1 Tax=Paratractidigestivibacter sp. TaxID=2847316 RepID=UPI002AC899A7|nr:hypothetical protein [Paratractidigestivibacter sp.]
MPTIADDRREACAQKTTAELDALAARGVRAGGNAYSPILVAKGELTTEETGGVEPFSGADGAALRASLKALGYAPEHWEWLLTCDNAGAPLAAGLFREAMCALDPATLVCCDDAAAAAVREAYADDLTILESFEEAMLEPGYVVQVCGIRVLNLGGFAASLADPKAKQQMWARLKRLPPLAEPY